MLCRKRVPKRESATMVLKPPFITAGAMNSMMNRILSSLKQNKKIDQ